MRRLVLVVVALAGLVAGCTSSSKPHTTLVPTLATSQSTPAAEATPT